MMLFQRRWWWEPSFDNGYVAIYIAAGLKVVQAKYASNYFQVGGAFTQNLTLAECRPATVSNAIFKNIQSDKTHGILCTRDSGGGAAGAFSLAFYGADACIDYDFILPVRTSSILLKNGLL